MHNHTGCKYKSLLQCVYSCVLSMNFDHTRHNHINCISRSYLQCPSSCVISESFDTLCQRRNGCSWQNLNGFPISLGKGKQSHNWWLWFLNSSNICVFKAYILEFTWSHWVHLLLMKQMAKSKYRSRADIKHDIGMVQDYKTRKGLIICIKARLYAAGPSKPLRWTPSVFLPLASTSPSWPKSLIWGNGCNGSKLDGWHQTKEYQYGHCPL